VHAKDCRIPCRYGLKEARGRAEQLCKVLIEFSAEPRSSLSAPIARDVIDGRTLINFETKATPDRSQLRGVGMDGRNAEPHRGVMKRDGPLALDCPFRNGNFTEPPASCEIGWIHLSLLKSSQTEACNGGQ